MILDISNIISAFFGLAGTCIIYKFGIPKRIDTGGKIPFVLLAKDNDAIKEVSRFRKISNSGLFCIALSFFLQFLNGIGLSWKIIF